MFKTIDSKKCLDCALLVLRIAAGIIFVYHGYGKLFGNMPGMTAFTGMVTGLGFPAPGLFAYLAALSEFFGGIALLLGVGVQYATIFLGVVMLVAWGGMKKFGLPVGDADFALLSIVIALFMTGAGKHTVMSLFGKKDGTS